MVYSNLICIYMQKFIVGEDFRQKTEGSQPSVFIIILCLRVKM
ncbi:hypothetical protein AusDCA_1123 [Desulfitobacterium sp. AusDCA]